jgi:hypothetical protein
MVFDNHRAFGDKADRPFCTCGQRWILDRDGLSAANDAKRTLLLAGLRGTWYPVEAEARVDQGRDSLVYVTVCAVLRYV